MTFYKADEKLPAFDDYAMQGRTYRYFDGQPLYPFGHGLSYTRFTYSDLELDSSEGSSAQAVQVTVKIRNTGDRAGEEVVQLYLKPKQAERERARKDLRGFQRIALKTGEERTLTFSFTPDADLRTYDEATSKYVVDPGAYEIQIGASSADIRVSDVFTVK